MKAGNKISPNLFNPSSQNDKLTNDDMLRLLDYYRMKVDMIEKEGFDWLTKLTEQITELQQSLSEANIALNQERKKVIHFSNEIDNYKCKKTIN